MTAVVHVEKLEKVFKVPERDAGCARRCARSSTVACARCARCGRFWKFGLSRYAGASA